MDIVIITSGVVHSPFRLFVPRSGSEVGVNNV